MCFSRWKEINSSLQPGINLLAVSKGQSISSIKKLAELGQVHFGESRVQEALPKQQSLGEYKLHWHFIGHLQSNKVRAVVRSFDYIHSVDTFNLAERISRISREENKNIKVMLQVKFMNDPNKGGFTTTNLLELWDDIRALKYLDIVGIMTMSPLNLDLKDRSVLFQNCRLFANRLQLQHCSMGMSSDWQEALNAGSTWLRIGSDIFGACQEKQT